MDRIAQKFETAKQYLPKAIVDDHQAARLGIIATGSADPAVKESRDLLIKKGIKSDYLRIRSLPFNEEVKEFLNQHERLAVVEMNRDGQLKQLLAMTFPDSAIKMTSIAHLDGLPLNARWVEEKIMAIETVQA